MQRGRFQPAKVFTRGSTLCNVPKSRKGKRVVGPGRLEHALASSENSFDSGLVFVHGTVPHNRSNSSSTLMADRQSKVGATVCNGHVVPSRGRGGEPTTNYTSIANGTGGYKYQNALMAGKGFPENPLEKTGKS